MSIDLPGFADPVADAQACFRVVLDAMARPGTVHTTAAPKTPPPLDRATAAVLLTLLDSETPVALAADCAPAQDWVAFHCGTPFVAPAAAEFVVARTMPDLAGLPAGSDAAPEAGATLILQVDGLDRGMVLQLSGPGLREPALLRVAGLPTDFLAQWRTNHALFPRGVDLILCAGAQLVALPRSVAIEAA